MIKALISDIAGVIIFSKDRSYKGTLNSLHQKLHEKPDYIFFDHFEVNTKLIEYYKTLKDKLDLFIFTSDTIQDAPELKPYWQGLFKQIYSASKMGTQKSLPEAYKMLINELKLLPEEIIFIDDNVSNIKAADSIGLQTIQYLNNEDLFLKIREKLTI